MQPFSAEFDEHFQQHYLAFLLRDTTFFQHVRHDVQPELFSADLGQKTARLIEGWAAEHEAPPGELILTEIDLLAKRATFSPDDINVLKTYIKKLLTLKLQNRQFLLDQHDRFMGHQRLLDAFPKFQEHMRKGNLDKARDLLNNLVSFRSTTGQMGTFFPADPTERIKRRQEEDTERFWLLIPELDKSIRGLKRGQLGVWQSQRSSAGKSTALIHLIKAFVLQKKKVLMFTLEDPQEEVEDKLDMCVAGITDRELLNKEKIERQLRWWYSFSGEVHIVEFSPGSKTSELRAYAHMLGNTKNWHADAVLVDYADLLAPEDSRLTGDTFATGHQVYIELNRWAKQDKVVLWTAAQSGRAAITETHADQEHIGLSLAKVWDATLIISINRTAEEQQEGLTNCFVVKNKNGPARFSKTIRSDFNTMHFVKVEAGA